MNSMLQASDLTCERGGRELFRALGFGLEAGEALRIAGANGSGKTSLVRILAGLLAPTAGEVLWKGEEIAALREQYSRELVYVGHAAAVKDELTAAENLSIACRLAGDAVNRDAVQAALQRLGVPGGAIVVKRLSQGQRRRAALARLALAWKRPLWLLDEPFSALDPEGVAILGALIDEHRARGGAVVLTTHEDRGPAATRVLRLG